MKDNSNPATLFLALVIFITLIISMYAVHEMRKEINNLKQENDRLFGDGVRCRNMFYQELETSNKLKDDLYYYANLNNLSRIYTNRTSAINQDNTYKEVQKWLH